MKRNISIRNYFLLLFLTTAVACGILSYRLYKAANEITEITERMQLRNTIAFTAQNLRHNLTTLRRQALLTEIKGPADRQATSKYAQDALMTEAQSLSEISPTAADKEYLEKINQSLSTYLNQWSKARKRLLRGDKLYIATAGSYEDTIDAIQNLLQYNYDSAENSRDQANALSLKYRKSLVPLWVFFATSLFVLFWTFYILIYRPLKRFQHSVRDFKGPGPAHKKADSGISILEIFQIQNEFNQMKERLNRQNSQRLGFLAAIAHDLKNPLAALQMSLDILIAEVPELENREIAAVIDRQFKHLSRLVGDLLDTSRIELGQLRFEKTTFDLPQAVLDCVTLFKTLSRIHSFTFVNEAGACSVYADKDRIAQVINNLLSNAVKYSPNGGAITINARLEGETVVTSVSDEGVGISADDLENIFQPFRRSKLVQHDFPGVGLGLATSRKILEAHNGKLYVQSQIGHGTTFFFSLPKLS